MKIIGLLAGCALLGVGFFLSFDFAKTRGLEREEIPHFEPFQILDLEPFGDFDPEQHFSKDLSLVFYFNQLSCQTCTTRELRNMSVWYEQYSDQMDFYLVVQGENPVYLNNLKRLGQVKYPILLEKVPGSLGLSKTTLVLFRKHSQEILATYFPTPDQPHPKALALLEQRLSKELDATTHSGAKGGSI